jgi:branched-chain amino acid aminotransferase
MPEPNLIWFDGKIVPAADAKISVLAAGSQFGVTVFEGIRAYWNAEERRLSVFRLADHVQRLLQSARMIRFEHTCSSSDLTQSVIETIRANRFNEDIAIRQVLFLKEPSTWSSTQPVGLFVTAAPKGRLLPKDKAGLRCCVTSWQRISDNVLPPRIKVGANYVNSRLGQLEALRNGYDSAIFLNRDGRTAEGPGSCLFIVRNGRLITPPATASILESITRSTLMGIARDALGIEVVERDIDRTELYAADEAFLCGTSAEILPIISIDNLTVGDGTCGQRTRALLDHYFSVVRGQVSQYRQWLTEIDLG